MERQNQNRPEGNSDKNSQAQISKAETARQYCQKILSFFPLYGTIQVQAWEEKGKVLIEIYGDKSGILIGKHGQTLSALELVLTRILQHQTQSSVPIVLDCEGYRKRRKEMLERMARETALEVAETLTPINLGPMTSEERKIIHLALKNHPSVYTESQGTAPIKEILIKPRQT